MLLGLFSAKITLFVKEVPCLFVRAPAVRPLADKEPLLRLQNHMSLLDTLSFPQPSWSLHPPILQAGRTPGLRNCSVLLVAMMLPFPRSGCLRCCHGPRLIPPIRLGSHTSACSFNQHPCSGGGEVQRADPARQSLSLLSEALGPPSPTSMFSSTNVPFLGLRGSSVDLEDTENLF